MALILLDGLADAILHRRLQSLYRASEDPLTRREMRQYPKKLRREARLNFARRIEVAQESTYVLEEYLAEAVSAYDREINLQIDIARGK